MGVKNYVMRIFASYSLLHYKVGMVQNTKPFAFTEKPHNDNNAVE